uniref:Alpha/beta-Hydrolases superfamily protein n=1 Tax=Haemonchus contortus TaxID=6289 RepID=A0A7I4Y8W9_HAECO
WLTYRRPEGRSATANAVSIRITKLPNTKKEKNRNSPKVDDVTIVNRLGSVGKPSPSSGRRPRPQRRLCFVWNAPSASIRSSCPSSDASTLSWEDKRRLVVKLSNSKQAPFIVVVNGFC